MSPNPQSKELESLISEIKNQSSNFFQTAPWLKSQFSDQIWHCDFRPSSSSYDIDFNLALDNGSCLTDSTNLELLKYIKSWLCAHSSSTATGGVILQMDVLQRRTRQVLMLVDYFLSTPDYYQISEHGFGLITKSDVSRMFANFAKSVHASEKFYNWQQNLTTFLRANALNGIDNTEKTKKTLHNSKLNLSDHELQISKRWLEINDYYWSTGSLKIRRLADEVLGKTLAGHIINFPTGDLPKTSKSLKRVYGKVPSREDSNQIASQNQLSDIIRALRSSLLVKSCRVSISNDAIAWLFEAKLDAHHDLSKLGRFKTVPFEKMHICIRDSVDFYLNSGRAILDAMYDVLTMCQKLQITPEGYFTNTDLSLQPCTLGLQINGWTILQHGLDGKIEPLGKLPSHLGLWDYYLILIGAIQITTGALTARRISELLLLDCGDCLDERRINLKFKNSKSGFAGFRKTELRPIPKLISNMVGDLADFQKKLINIGISPSDGRLFSQVGIAGYKFNSTNFANYSRANDMFSDYFEADLDEKGRRYYIRQHSLRRFFAMCFYWGDSPGGLDTLRWFLGHLDPSYVYNYITEATTGEILNSVKIDYLLRAVTENKPNVEIIKQKIESFFGCNEVFLLEQEEVEDYLRMLIENRKIFVEPKFYHADDGNKYEIQIRIEE